MLNIAVFVSGGGTNLKAIMDSIDNGVIQNAKIELVVSDRIDAYALIRAKENGIKTKVITKKEHTSSEEFGNTLIECMSENNIDLIVLAGYLAIIPSVLIKYYTNRIINVHPSLIPAFCGKGFYGLKVHEAVLNRGAKLTGATVHFVDEGTDTGPIIIQQAVEVREDDTKVILQKRVMEEAEWKILPMAIHLIANNKIKVIDNKVKFL